MLKKLEIVFWLTITGKLFGFIRLQQLGARLGNVSETDALFAVLNVSMFWEIVVISGAFGSIFIPKIIEKRMQQGDVQAKELSQRLFSLMLIASAFVSGAMFVLAKPLLKLFAPGLLTDDVSQLALSLFRILSVMPLLIAFVQFPTLLQQAYKRNAVAAINPCIWYPLQCLFLLLLPVTFSNPASIVYNLAFLWIVGYAIAGAIQWMTVPLEMKGFRLAWPGSHQIDLIKSVVILSICVGFTEVNVLVDQAFASAMPDGGVSIIAYASRPVRIFLSVLAAPVLSVWFPILAELNINQRDDLRQTTSKIISGMVAVFLPMVLFLALCSKLVAGAIYGEDAFSAVAFSDLSWSIRFYSAGILFEVVSLVLIRTLYVVGTYKILVPINILLFIFNILFDYIGFHTLGVKGIPLATAVVSLVQLAALAVIMAKRDLRLISWSWLQDKLQLLAIVAVAAISLVLIPNVSELDFISVVVKLLIFILLYLALGIAFNVKELDLVIEPLRRQLQRKQASRGPN